MKIHLIDGTYELYRGYFGPPPRKAPDGREVGATVGMLRSLVALLNDPDVTHIACAFDHVIESFRNDLFDGYKTGDGVPEKLWQQFPLAEEAIAALGIVVWPMVDFEADDAIATAAHRFQKDDQVEQVVICSPDKDLVQMVTGNKIVSWDRRREIIYDEKAVKEKFGIAPASIPDYLALVGDAADGIPGIPGWGAKSSATVLANYHLIDKIPHDPSSWEVSVRGAARLAGNLNQLREEADLYKTLATLRTDVPLKESVEDLRWTGPNDTFQQVCQSLGVDDLFSVVSELN